MKKEQRLLVGKQIHDGTLLAPDAMKEYEVGYTTVCSWRRQYEESAGLAEPAPKTKPLGVSPGATNPREYESMGKNELIKELMRRDIEVARLKKGYSVKGGGSKKEYVTFSGLNTK